MVRNGRPRWISALLTSLLALMSAEKLQQTLEAAFHSGTLMIKNNGIVCSCAPGKKYPLGWGRRASEWKAHEVRVQCRDRASAAE